MIGIFWNRTQRRLRCGWRLLLQVVLTILALLVFALPIIFAALILNVDLGPVGEQASGALAQSSALLAAVFAAAKWLDRRSVASLGIGAGWWKELVIGSLLGAITMGAIFAMEWSLGWISIVRIGIDDQLAWQSLVSAQLWWLVVMIAVGFSEEFLSRGYHLKNLAEGFQFLGPTAAICLATLLSSLVFGALHAGNENASPISTLSIVLAGVMLATGRIATNSLAAPIGLHITWNLFQGPILGFPVSGTSTEGSIIELVQAGDPFWSGGAFGPEAGLVGLIAELILIAVFIIWGRQTGGFQKSFVRLTRYRNRYSRQHKSVRSDALSESYGSVESDGQV